MLVKIDYYISSLTHSFRKPSVALPLCLVLALARDTQSPALTTPGSQPPHSPVLWALGRQEPGQSSSPLCLLHC